MLALAYKEFEEKIKVFEDFYELRELQCGAELWYVNWREKKLDREELKNLEIVEVIKEATEFFPIIKNALYQ